MKKRVWLFVLSVCFFAVITSAQEDMKWKWAASIGSDMTDQANHVITDKSGNCYVTGYFASDQVIIEGDTLENKGGNDFLLVKYNEHDTTDWVLHVGSTGHELGYGMAIDSSENIYVAGYFNANELIFGDDTLETAGGYDAFLVKVQPDGNIVWAVQGGGSNDDYGIAADCDTSGNVFLGGRIASSDGDFDGISLSSTNTSDDVFVAKYDTAGTILWAQSAGGVAIERCYDITTDIRGNVYLTGWMSSSSITFGDSTLNSNGFFDFFLLKWDVAGNPVWGVNAGGSQEDEGFGITSDHAGHIYVTGNFHSATIAFEDDTLESAGDRDIFLVKYDTSGHVLWALNSGGELQDRGEDVEIGSDGNIYIAGWFESDSMVVGTDTLTCAGERDILVACYSADGDSLWAKSAGGEQRDYGTCLSVTTDLEIYVSGRFESTDMDLDSLYIESGGGIEIFVARLSACDLTISLGNDTTLYNDQDILLSPGGWFDIYLWSDGSTDYSLSLDTTITGLGTFEYLVQVTDSLGCSATDTIIVTFELATDLAEHDGDSKEAKVIPNPVSGTAIIKFTPSDDITTIVIYDITGRKVLLKKEREKGLFRIDVENLTPGVYTYRIQDESGHLYSGKFIIQ